MIEQIAVNGTLHAPKDAKISVFDRGYLYGDAVYEVTRSYGPILFLLEDHLDRLQRSAQQIGLQLDRTREQWVDELYRLHRACQAQDAYLRLQISRGEGAIGLDPLFSTAPNVVVFIRPVTLNKPEYYRHGCAIMTTPVLRNTKQSIDPNIKSGNYLNNILAIRHGSGRDVQECLMQNRQGYLTEGTTSNFFIVQDGVVRTPSDDEDILFGITRNKVRQLCRDLGLTLQEGAITVADLERADEVFLTSSVREIMPVATVNGHAVRQAPGPITQRLREGYAQLIQDYIRWANQHHPWK